MKFILVVIFYVHGAAVGDPPPTPAIAEFNSLKACETALAEVGRRAPPHTRWTAFCAPKGLGKF